MPELLRERPLPLRAALVAIVPAVFGGLTGLLLGVSEPAYVVMSVLGIGGGYFAGFEHRGARSGALRGLLGGSLFGASILLAHEASGASPKAHLPEPEILLVAITTAFGVGLGALGGRKRAQLEAAGEADRPYLDLHLLRWSELVSAAGGALLVWSLWLPWFATSCATLSPATPSGCNPHSVFDAKPGVDRVHGQFDAVESFASLPLLLIIAAAIPAVLAWMIARGRPFTWPPGEAVMIAGIYATVLVLLNGVVLGRPGAGSVEISLQYGYLLAIAGGLAIVAGGLMRRLSEVRPRPAAATATAATLALTALALLGGATDASAQAGASYTVPGDNPFVGQAGARPEIWAYGLRNPWRFSFDRSTGDLTIADVGQDAVEEVDFARAHTGAGANYGWNCFEGSRPFAGAPAGCTAPGHVPPVLEYSSEGDAARCSITGGYVVRDGSLPIAGSYVYGDFCTGELRAADLAAGGAQNDRALNVVVPAISSFGEDAAGRIYAASLGGPVFRLRAGAGPAPVLLEPVGVFDTPVYATSQPDDADRLFVVEKTGRIQLVDGAGPPVTFLDISADLATDDLERGLLSVAFAPDYATSGLFYVYYNDTNGDVTIEEFRRSESNPDSADPATRRVLLKQEHRQFANHNGGQLQFGPDGLLYAALGDGGGGGDPLRNGQNLGTLLGKVIRIDPRRP